MIAAVTSVAVAPSPCSCPKGHRSIPMNAVPCWLQAWKTVHATYCCGTPNITHHCRRPQKRPHHHQFLQPCLLPLVVETILPSKSAVYHQWPELQWVPRSNRHHHHRHQCEPPGPRPCLEWASRKSEALRRPAQLWVIWLARPLVKRLVELLESPCRSAGFVVYCSRWVPRWECWMASWMDSPMAPCSPLAPESLAVCCLPVDRSSGRPTLPIHVGMKWRR
mmetsp:Transcript_11513/g.25633  ORF Transcript_11513/g.25633 Transcript_11513/m.25633 type:complete len:221 (+) Transcript_11513:57-719(+)